MFLLQTGQSMYANGGLSNTSRESAKCGLAVDCIFVESRHRSFGLNIATPTVNKRAEAINIATVTARTLAWP